MKDSADNILKYFSSSYKTGFVILCKLSSQEIICMKCQSLFSGKNKKKTNLTPAEFAQRVVKINPCPAE